MLFSSTLAASTRERGSDWVIARSYNPICHLLWHVCACYPAHSIYTSWLLLLLPVKMFLYSAHMQQITQCCMGVLKAGTVFRLTFWVYPFVSMTCRGITLLHLRVLGLLLWYHSYVLAYNFIECCSLLLVRSLMLFASFTCQLVSMLPIALVHFVSPCRVAYVRPRKFISYLVTYTKHKHAHLVLLWCLYMHTLYY